MRSYATIRALGAGRNGARGFTTVEVMVAVAIIATVTLVSLMAQGKVVDLSVAALGLIGKQATGGAGQKTARLRTIAAEWVQAQLEYARQLGYQGECNQSSCTWYLPGPALDCSGTAATPPSPDPTDIASIIGALGSAPSLPPDFVRGRIVVSWDPNTPSYTSVDPTTGQQTTQDYLQDVEVDVYRSQTDCVSQNSYTVGYTAVSIR